MILFLELEEKNLVDLNLEQCIGELLVVDEPEDGNGIGNDQSIPGRGT